MAWNIYCAGSNGYRTNSYRRILNYARENNEDILLILDKLERSQIRIPYTTSLVERYTEVKNKISRLSRLLSQDREAVISIIDEHDEENNDLRNIISSTIEEIGLMEDEEIQKWYEKMYSTILEYIAFPQNVAEQDHVRIMSLHASKGYAKYVVVMSCIDELLPRIERDATPEES